MTILSIDNMKISGFSFVRNGSKLYYPVKESIQSMLPLCDEIVVAIGEGDADDTSRQDIMSIGSEKIRIIDTVWDEKYMKHGAIHAYQTDLAMKACSGDWLLYLQADELIHEKDIPAIRRRCEQLLGNEEIEGLLFDYYHFWGDYEHYHYSHGWYAHEIRIIRNLPEIHSWQSAQSFRHFQNYERPHQREGTRKLRVAKVDAHIYHYGWVRPPHLMQSKSRAIDSNHKGIAKANEIYDALPKEFDYGPLQNLAKFTDTHPEVMKEMIAKHDWKNKLQYSGKPSKDRLPHKHEKFRYRLVSFIENNFFGGRRISSFRNYELMKNI